jgi:hypothetical protein
VLCPNNNDGKRSGERVERIDTEDSYQFCSQCADLLGYCLQAELSDEEVRIMAASLGE